MGHRLRNRSFLTLSDFTPEDIEYLLDMAAELKAAKYAGTERPRLANKNIALIFEKDSTRTRCAFEVATHDQGAHVTYIGPTGSHIGVKETVKDTARVLGRMYDAIEYRGFGQKVVEDLAEHAGVPVWNGLTDEFHPTQTLADFLTMREHVDKPLTSVSFCFLGDSHNNIADSLMLGAAKLGMDFRLGSPAACHPRDEVLAYATDLARERGGSIVLTEDIDTAVKGVDFLYTDVWVSMGEPDSVWDERIEMLRPYQVTMDVLKRSGNSKIKFMHCLPAFHNRDTEKGRKIFEKYGLDGMEVTEEVFESKHSIVFDQAENRLHTIKAVMVATLGD